VDPLAPILERLYATGCRSPANQHRLETVFRLHGEGIGAERLLQGAFDAFRPGDGAHPARLVQWWADGRLKIQRLQLWEGGEPDAGGVYTWRGPQAKTLAHHYTLATPLGPVRFTGAVERATDPALAGGDLETVVRMGDARDPTLYGPGGAVPPAALSLASDFAGNQSWRFSRVSDGVRIVHVSEGRRLARDAALFALFGSAATLFFRLLHDLEMRRGLRPLPGYLQRMLNEPNARITLRLERPHGLTEANHGGPPWAA
jgi:hypothetical protein